MIKLTKLFLALSLFLFLTSCGSDDEVTTSNDLQGTWSVISFTAELQSTTTFGGDVLTGTTNIEGSNMDYDLTFAEATYTTSGSYDISTSSMIAGTTQENNQSYTDVSGNGTYTTSGDVMTIGGSFFELEVDGMAVVTANGEQMANYEINSNGNLVFSQDDETTTTANGSTSTSRTISTSVWEKN